MSEVKNEGVEVVATLTVSFDEGDGGSAIEQVETHTLLDEGAHDLCRHSEALAVIAGREARIAELEEEVKTSAECLDMANELYETHKDKNCQLRAELAALNARLDASKFCADVADDLRAESADAKETISRYEVTAENCDVLRAELANQLEVKAFWIGRTRALEVELVALKAQVPVSEVSEETFSSDGTSDVITHNLPIGTKLYAAPFAKQDYGPLTCDYCGAETRDPWHGSGSINGTESKHIHACDNCRDLLPVAKQVVMPERDQLSKAMKLLREANTWIVPKGNMSVSIFGRIGNFLDEVANLNASDHFEGGQDE
ncbi:MAG: hypothetical protein K2X80_02790 [Pseudomonadaceae bacterium]|nr:hypothetical protein [Pseudomonadaceae bacterium]